MVRVRKASQPDEEECEAVGVSHELFGFLLMFPILLI